MKFGAFRHVVTVEEEQEVPDGEGGFTMQWVQLNPAKWHCSITPATVRDLEREAAGTVIATASHIIAGRFHPQITVKTRLTKGSRDAQGKLTPGSREFNVSGVQNPEEKNESLVLMAEEIVPQ